jgi:hypothetical protein
MNFILLPPPPCNRTVLEEGNIICEFTASSYDAENWVKKIRKLSKQNVDWHYVKRICVIKTLGDVKSVIDAIFILQQELNGKIISIAGDKHGKP